MCVHRQHTTNALELIRVCTLCSQSKKLLKNLNSIPLITGQGTSSRMHTILPITNTVLNHRFPPLIYIFPRYNIDLFLILFLFRTFYCVFVSVSFYVPFCAISHRCKRVRSVKHLLRINLAQQQEARPISKLQHMFVDGCSFTKIQILPFLLN